MECSDFVSERTGVAALRFRGSLVAELHGPEKLEYPCGSGMLWYTDRNRYDLNITYASN